LPLKQSAASAKKLLKTSKADAAAEMLKEMKQRRQNEQICVNIYSTGSEIAIYLCYLGNASLLVFKN
jgi:hypothetical protein